MLEEQRADLAGCLDALWADIHTGTRRFKLYRQIKMYNDPDLNPVRLSTLLLQLAVDLAAMSAYKTETRPNNKK